MSTFPKTLNFDIKHQYFVPHIQIIMPLHDYFNVDIEILSSDLVHMANFDAWCFGVKDKLAQCNDNVMQ